MNDDLNEVAHYEPPHLDPHCFPSSLSILSDKAWTYCSEIFGNTSFVICFFSCLEAELSQSGKNIWKMKFFPGQGKSGNFVDCQGNLEKTWKVREKSGNLKINGYDKQTSENLFILYL